MHDGEHSDVIGLDRVQHAVWKAPNQSPPHRADDTSSRLRVLDDLRYAAFNSGDECRTQSDTLSLEVLGRLCEAASSPAMARGRGVFHTRSGRTTSNDRTRVQPVDESAPGVSPHTRSGVAKHILRGAGAVSGLVPTGISTLGLFGPQTSVLLFGKILEAGEKLLSQAGTVLRFQLQHLGFQLVDAHPPIVTPSATIAERRRRDFQ